MRQAFPRSQLTSPPCPHSVRTVTQSQNRIWQGNKWTLAHKARGKEGVSQGEEKLLQKPQRLPSSQDHCSDPHALRTTSERVEPEWGRGGGIEKKNLKKVNEWISTSIPWIGNNLLSSSSIQNWFSCLITKMPFFYSTFSRPPPRPPSLWKLTSAELLAHDWQATSMSLFPSSTASSRAGCQDLRVPSSTQPSARDVADTKVK